MALPEPTSEHLTNARQMRAKARKGWFNGTRATLEAFSAKRLTVARTTPELIVCVLLSRDRAHHGCGWFRNAEYEYCWHLSLSARDRLAYAAAQAGGTPGSQLGYQEVPRDEVRYWSRLIFGEHVDKLWNEPGGGDPSLTQEQAHRNSLIWHLRLFLDPETQEPFIPTGEVYTLTRWIDGLTPEKVDR
jgi:hypothetical protein